MRIGMISNVHRMPGGNVNLEIFFDDSEEPEIITLLEERIYLARKFGRRKRKKFAREPVPEGAGIRELDVVEYNPDEDELFLNLRATDRFSRYYQKMIMTAIEEGFKKSND